MFGPLQVLKFFSKVKKGTLDFNAKVCVRYRSRDAQCRICEQVCPEGAINWDKEDEVFDGLLCSECGICIAECPVEALSLADMSPASVQRGVTELESLLMEESSAGSSGNSEADGQRSDLILLACRRQTERSEELAALARSYVIADVKCVGSISPAFLTSMSVSANGQIVFVSNGCENCPDRSGYESFANFLDSVNEALDGPAPFQIIDPRSMVASENRSGETMRPRHVAMYRNIIKEDNGLSRREFFKGMSSSAAHHAGKAVSERVLSISDQQLKDVRYENRVPVSRQLLLQVIGSKGEGWSARSSSELSRHLRIARIDVSEDCDLCFTCSDLCPTSALTEKGEPISEDSETLLFYQERCTACNLCAEVCHKKAISLRAGRVRDLKDIASGAGELSPHRLK